MELRLYMQVEWFGRRTPVPKDSEIDPHHLTSALAHGDSISQSASGTL